MPRIDDIARPAEDFVVIHASPKMNAEAALLLSSPAYARFDREPARDAKAILKRAICSTFGALDEAVTITEHFPEPYLVRFIFPHIRAAAVARHSFLFEGHKKQIRPWRLEDNADQVELRQHVRLCVENVPMYLWNDAVAVQQAIGRACSLEYVEDACKLKTYTKALCLWAWVGHPGLVPRVRWVTLPGPSSGAAERGRRGLQRRCIVHLDILEDMTLEAAPMPGKFSWRWGVIDGERLMRDRAERLLDDGGSNNGRGRRDDEDDALGRRGRDGSRGWRQALRRSLSRGAGFGARDAGQEGQRHRDRANHRDEGRRRHGDLSVQVHANLGSPSAVEQVEMLQAQTEPILTLALSNGASSFVVALGSPTLVSHGLGMPRDWGFGLDSGDALDAVLGVGTGRLGRGWRRPASPRAARRRSRAALTPPVTPDPPSSPTSVIPSSPAAKGCGQELLQVSSEGHDADTITLSPHAPSTGVAAMALALLAPDFMVDGSPTSRPPGFEASPEPRTPPLDIDGSPARTPEPAARSRRPNAAPAPVVTTSVRAPLAPLFVAAQPPILSPPMSSPPVRPLARRKTLAGADITRTVRFSLRKPGARNKQHKAVAPIARKAETMVCKGLGIIKDGEEVTEWALAEFASRFKGRVEEEVIKAMRALFKVGTDEDDTFDDTMLAHGGAAALDLDGPEAGSATAEV